MSDFPMKCFYYEETQEQYYAWFLDSRVNIEQGIALGFFRGTVLPDIFYK